MSPAMWKDETVVIVGNAPGMTTELADTLRGHKTIAVNRAVLHAPWADVLVSIDGNWPDTAFAGERICGVPNIAGATYMPLPYEHVAVAHGRILHFRNNAMSALRLAAWAGARKIILAGFDTCAYEALHAFDGLTVGMDALVAELRAGGIEVERLGAPAKPARRKRGRHV